jgi:hypothetical protein
LNSASSIVTASGKFFHPSNPDYKKIDILDIAHVLSRQTRFSGHTSGFWSVANHSILVSRLVAPEYALTALLHDAAEAYLVDLPSPVKNNENLWVYKLLEDDLHAAVSKAFSLPTPWPETLHEFDRAAMWAEADHFMSGWLDWNFKPRTAREFAQLSRARGEIERGTGQPLVNRIAGKIGFYSADATERLFLREFSRLNSLEFERHNAAA